VRLGASFRALVGVDSERLVQWIASSNLSP
jgi:hypothetical protein